MTETCLNRTLMLFIDPKIDNSKLIASHLEYVQESLNCSRLSILCNASSSEDFVMNSAKNQPQRFKMEVPIKIKTNAEVIKGGSIAPNRADFSDSVEFKDHKIKFAVRYCREKDVLDLGCVQHNPENYKSKYWLHKALQAVASSITGIDLYKDGVDCLNELGFNVVFADAQQFDLGRTFDVVVAGDLIEHLENFHGFLESCKKHMHGESRLIISTPNPWYWRNVVKAALRTDVSNNPEHTCWLCPRTLRQLLNRHGLDIGEIAFGSRYLRDRVMPLPQGLKHTSFHVEAYKVS